MNNRKSLEYTLADIERSKREFVSRRVIELQAIGLTAAEAEQEALDEWEPRLLVMAPACWSCEYIGPEQIDPYGTGDSPTLRDCEVPGGHCPWGK